MDIQISLQTGMFFAHEELIVKFIFIMANKCMISCALALVEA